MATAVLAATFTSFMLIIFSVFLLAKLDDLANWNWFIVFMPIYFLQFLFAVDSVRLIFKIRLSFKSKLVKLLALIAALFLIYLFEILLCLKLEGFFAASKTLKYSFVFLPFWIVLLAFITFLIVSHL